MTKLLNGQSVIVEVANDDFLTNDQCGSNGPMCGTYRGPVAGQGDLHLVETQVATFEFYTDEIKAA